LRFGLLSATAREPSPPHFPKNPTYRQGGLQGFALLRASLSPRLHRGDRQVGWAESDSPTHEGHRRWEASFREERISISRLELVRRISEGGEEGVVGVPEIVADSLAGGEKERSLRFLGARRDGVGALTANGVRSQRRDALLLPRLRLLLDLAGDLLDAFLLETRRKILPARERG